jgi:hypothetical protein
MKGKELEKIHEAAEEVIAGEISETYAVDQEKELYFLLGGLDALNTVASNMNAAVIINLQRIRDEQLYLAAGYTRFDAFMDEHPKATMSYKRFNYVEGVFKNLGHQIFDLLNGSGLSMRQQKLLGKGNVEIVDDKVIVHNDDQTTEIEINNRRQWLESLRALADANAEKSIKLERQQTKLDKHAEQLAEAADLVQRAKAACMADLAADAHMTARVELGLSFGKFTDIVSTLTNAEKEQYRDDVLEHVASWSNALRFAYRTDGTERPVEPAIEGDTLEEAVDNYLDDVDDDNDGDLAAKL